MAGFAAAGHFQQGHRWSSRRLVDAAGEKAIMEGSDMFADRWGSSPGWRSGERHTMASAEMNGDLEMVEEKGNGDRPASLRAPMVATAKSDRMHMGTSTGTNYDDGGLFCYCRMLRRARASRCTLGGYNTFDIGDPERVVGLLADGHPGPNSTCSHSNVLYDRTGLPAISNYIISGKGLSILILCQMARLVGVPFCNAPTAIFLIVRQAIISYGYLRPLATRQHANTPTRFIGDHA